jgi:hypothetical protein
MPTHDDIADLQKAFYALYNVLKDAYWAASTVEAKDQIHGAKDLVDQVLDLVDRADLETDNNAMTELTQTLKLSVKDLRDLQKQLDGIVHNVTVATTAISTIDKTLAVAGKLVPIATGAGL